ncbi:MAG TPA: hypothetical protein VNU68_33925 [Verrucomicrobiae bacterium]|nr:hypothetical protein [Verrucomicrobiae bacterium]
MTVLSSAWQGGHGQKQACIVGGLMFDSGSLQIRWQTVRGGATIRVAVAGLMLGLWLVLVALGSSPQLHRLLHADSSQPSHDCVVTQLTKSQFLTAGGAISAIVVASSFFGFPPLTERIALPAADIRLAPPRGPPSASFLL